MQEKTLSEAWASFLADSNRGGEPSPQEAENLKQCFYAGCFFGIGVALDDGGGLSILDEIKDFFHLKDNT